MEYYSAYTSVNGEGLRNHRQEDVEALGGFGDFWKSGKLGILERLFEGK
jgi:hypothetical protein